MGVSATGKTVVGQQLAEHLGLGFIEGDAFHPQANIDKMSRGTPLDDADRLPWLEALADAIAEHEASGVPVVITCSALKRGYRDILRGGTPGTDLFFVHLHAEVDVLTERMASRTGHFMPTSLLRSQLDTLDPLGSAECGALVDVSPPLDLVVDAAVRAVRDGCR